MRAGRRLVEDFLLPALNDQRYGDLLKWEDKEKLHFSIRWSHKNAAKWSLDDTQVFQDWDRMKGHFHPEVKGYYMQAKQRFRAALYKLNTVKKLKSEDKHVKKYQLVDKYQFMLENPKKRQEKHSEYGGLMKDSLDEIQKCIPTAVICWNDGHADRIPDQSSPWQPPVLPKVPEPSAINYLIPNGHNSYREVPTLGCRSSPLLQENHVTSVQDQQFVKAEAEVYQTSASMSSPIHSARSISDCSHDVRMDRSREFFAKLNLVERSSVRTNSEPNTYQSNKKLCVPSTESDFVRMPKRELDIHCHEASGFVHTTEVKTEPPNLLCVESEDKNRNASAKIAPESSRPVSFNGSNVSSEVVDSATCTPKSKKESISQRRHLIDASRKASGSPHVPIPPLPGYSKSSVVPRKTEGQHNAFLIRDHVVSHKAKPNLLNNSTTEWQKANSIPSVVDGPLNLSTKPDRHYKSESLVFTDR